MSDEDWTNHLSVMNVHLEGVESQFQRATTWLRANTHVVTDAMRNFSAGVTTDIEDTGVIETGREIGVQQRTRLTGLVGDLFGR